MFKLRPVALVLALGLAAAGTASAQETPGPRRASNSFFVELGGNGLVYSLNGEHFFTPKLGVRVGAGLLAVHVEDSSGDSDANVLLVPVMGTYLLGEGNSHFEVGAGVGLATAGIDDVDLGNEHASALYGTATFGYRYQKPTGGVVFRAGFTPIVAAGNIIPWVGVGVGYAF